MWATHGPLIRLNTLAFPQSVLYHAGHPKERKPHMQDIAKVPTEATLAAIRILGLFGEPTTREGLENLLALAYARGAYAAAKEAAEAVKSA